MNKHRLLAAASLLATSVHAHEGHAMAGSHWHATDIFGLLLIGGVAAVVYWFFGGGK